MSPPAKPSGTAVSTMQGLKRPLPQDNSVAASPPAKRTAGTPIAKKAAGSVMKAPAGGKAGLSAKMTATGNTAKPPGTGSTQDASSAGVAEASTATPKPTGQIRAVEKSTAPSSSAPPQANGAAKPDGVEPPSRVVTSIRELLFAMKASPAPNKLRDAATLGNALGHNLPIEHLALFLRSLKKTLGVRGQREGVRVPAVVTAKPKAVAKGPPLAAKSTAPGAANAAKPVPEALATQASTKEGDAKVAAAQQPAPPQQDQQQQQQQKQQSPKQQQPPKAKAISKTPPSTGNTATPSKPAPPTAPPARQVATSKPASIPAKETPVPLASPPVDTQTAETLLDLVGEFTENPVCEDGEIKEARLDEVLRRLWDGAARKPKDWMAAWQAMCFPLDKQVEALQKFLNMAFVRTDDPDKAPAIIAELVKNHKVKMRSVEEVLVTFGSNLDGILAMNEDAWKIYSKFLCHVFPKPGTAGWGWSRVGWSWQSWWQFAEKCVQSTESAKAFDILALMLRLIQDNEGSNLAELPTWTDGDKLQRTLTKMCELGSCSAGDVIDRLAVLGVVVDTS